MLYFITPEIADRYDIINIITLCAFSLVLAAYRCGEVRVCEVHLRMSGTSYSGSCYVCVCLRACVRAYLWMAPILFSPSFDLPNCLKKVTRVFMADILLDILQYK